ncbi:MULTISPECIES: DUF397 domain-containing protein [Streptomyces]|uniref:DUF397 domain-containing protein n=1 Tax=Streptomyces TaxID=1883 RepID=UPI000998629B|nr:MULTISPECIES: DUF397 domain-containing protein [Streptomyces]
MTNNAAASPSPEWRKSSYSSNNGGNCVEIADSLSGNVPMRDSKRPRVVTTFSRVAWAEFVQALKDGHF